ncbi:MAG: two-component system LytT family response regulator [Lentimonas sp.]|jgi:two-component system LytT family response regulator
MKKVLIIDDEKRTRDLIAKMVLSFDLNLYPITDGISVETGIKAINTHKPDIVLLDIQMPDGTGFDVIQSVEYKDFKLIFITAHEEFAIKAIKFSALDYILKPIDQDELETSIFKAIKEIDGANQNAFDFEALQHNALEKENSKKKLVLKTQESVYVVELTKIVRLESDRNYTTFHLRDGEKVVVSKSLKEYESILNGTPFMRTNQSHIINLEHFLRYDKLSGGTVVMKDNSIVPLSNSKKDQFFERLESL